MVSILSTSFQSENSIIQSHHVPFRVRDFESGRDVRPFKPALNWEMSVHHHRETLSFERIRPKGVEITV